MRSSFCAFSFRLAGTSFLLAAAFGFCSTAHAATISVGNPVVVAGNIDSCSNCGYIVGQTFGTAGYTVSSYSFYSGTTSGDIMAVLYTGVQNANGTTTFTVTGVGADQKVSATGVTTLNFGLVSGSALTLANTYFGFDYLTGPVVDFSSTGNTVNGGTFLTNPPPGLGGSVTLENTVFNNNTANSLDNRQYSITATATSAVTPEPSSLLLLGTGVLAAFGVARRRFFQA